MSEKKPTAKIDLFKELLPALNRGDKEFYTNLSPEKQKTFSPWLVMRWASSVVGKQSTGRLIAINKHVNHDFSTIGKEHNELVWKHMAVVASESTGKTQARHQWIPPGRKKGKNAIQEHLSKVYTTAKADELELLEQMHTKAELKDLFKSLGYDDKTIKGIL